VVSGYYYDVITLTIASYSSYFRLSKFILIAVVSGYSSDVITSNIIIPLISIPEYKANKEKLYVIPGYKGNKKELYVEPEYKGNKEELSLLPIYRDK
jgi:hypothetical protein